MLDANGEGTTSNMLCGVDWLIANAAAKRIVAANFSLGAPGAVSSMCASDPEHQAFCDLAAAGVVPVVAAGNSGVDFAGPRGQTRAAYREVLTVSAIADTDAQPGGLGFPTDCTSATSTRTTNTQTSVQRLSHHGMVDPE